MDHAEVLSTMIQQEKSRYLTKQGLYNGQTSIDDACRSLMVGWCLKIAKYFKCHHHVVAVAINTLDRYVSVEPQILDDASDFQLFTMTCMYIAVKVYDTNPVASETLAQISNGSFSASMIEETELEILMKLKWRVSTPTATAFAFLYLELLSKHHVINCSEKETMEKLIQFQIDTAMQDCQFLGTLASDLALTVVCNASLIIEGLSARLAAYQTINKTLSVKLLPFDMGKQLLDTAKKSDILRSEKFSENTASTKQATSGLSCHKVSPRSIAVSSS